VHGEASICVSFVLLIAHSLLWVVFESVECSVGARCRTTSMSESDAL